MTLFHIRSIGSFTLSDCKSECEIFFDFLRIGDVNRSHRFRNCSVRTKLKCSLLHKMLFKMNKV